MFLLSPNVQLPPKFPNCPPNVLYNLKAFFFLSSGTSQGLDLVAFGCLLSLASFNVDQYPIPFILLCVNFMTLTFLQITGQLLCGMSHNLDLTAYVLMIKCKLNISGKS
jgi:hypothetical protein